MNDESEHNPCWRITPMPRHRKKLIESLPEVTSGALTPSCYSLNPVILARIFARITHLTLLHHNLTRHCSVNHGRIRPCTPDLDPHALPPCHLLPSIFSWIEQQLLNRFMELNQIVSQRSFKLSLIKIMAGVFRETWAFFFTCKEIYCC